MISIIISHVYEVINGNIMPNKSRGTDKDTDNLDLKK
jgi:hypothetical protein